MATKRPAAIVVVLRALALPIGCGSSTGDAAGDGAPAGHADVAGDAGAPADVPALPADASGAAETDDAAVPPTGPPVRITARAVESCGSS